MALATKDFANSLPASGGTTVRNTLSPWVHLVAGASGGLVNSIATTPLDVLRTRMQSDTYKTATQDKISNVQRLRHVHPIRETIDALRTIHRTEGIRGLFRGLVPSLIGVVPAQAVKFYVYGNCKRLGAQYLGLEEAEPLVHAQAAVAAGLATATATNPIWLVKTRMQLLNNQSCGSGSHHIPSRGCPHTVATGAGRGLQSGQHGTLAVLPIYVGASRLARILLRVDATPSPFDSFSSNHTGCI